MKHISIYLSLALLLITSAARAQRFTTYKFAERDTCDLYMDVYQPDPCNAKNVCVIYVFGGGFLAGERNGEFERKFCTDMADRGYTAIAIDYRLGMKGVKKMKVTDTRPLYNAIYMAVDDLIASIAYIIDNNGELKVNPDRIVISGSSAGAITSLTADYLISRRLGSSTILPQDFRLAGVMSFAGGVYTEMGKIRYSAHSPAPTLFIHGTKDKIVPYKKIAFCKKRMVGSSVLHKIFTKEDYPHQILRAIDREHEMAGANAYMLNEIDYFINTFVVDKRNYIIDETIDLHIKESGKYKKMDFKDLYKKE